MKIKEILKLLYIFNYMLEPNRDFSKNYQNLSTKRKKTSRTPIQIKLLECIQLTNR